MSPLSPCFSRLAAFTLLISCVQPAPAGEWAREKEKFAASCSNLFVDLKMIGSCGAFLFNSGEPLRLTVPQSVVPGGGTALGAVFIQPVNIKDWAGSNFTVTGGSSIRQFWFGDATLTLSHRRWGGVGNSARDRFQLQVYGRARGLPRMPFYGIGPNTSRSNIADYSERDISAGVSVINPLSAWLGLGGGIEFLKPQVTGSTGTSVRSISTYFSEATAPGLTHQPSFAHYSASLQPKFQWPRAKFHSLLAYDAYQDLGSGHYSFQRFRADVLQTFYPETQREPTNGGSGQTRRQPKYDSVLYIAGRFSTSWAGSNNVVPFYLQETLGGSDIDNTPTLRGYQDYRFRAPDVFSLQAQYERRLLPAPQPGSARPSTLRSVAGALGILAFYDAGEVATKADNLSFSDVRHSFGFGFTFWSAEKVWFRAYIGLGSGEGRHTFVGVTNPSNGTLHL